VRKLTDKVPVPCRMLWEPTRFGECRIKGSQLGASEGVVNWIGYVIRHAPMRHPPENWLRKAAIHVCPDELVTEDLTVRRAYYLLIS